jgi:hypothetical protein
MAATWSTPTVWDLCSTAKRVVMLAFFGLHFHHDFDACRTMTQSNLHWVRSLFCKWRMHPTSCTDAKCESNFRRNLCLFVQRRIRCDQPTTLESLLNAIDQDVSCDHDNVRWDDEF